MPRACTICTSPKKSAIIDAIAAGGSNRAVAERFQLTHTAVLRHKRNCMGISPKREAPTPAPLEGAETIERTTLGGSERFDSLEPKVLIAGTARLVDEALSLLEHAKKKDDRRLALAALKEARDGLALLMKAAGMLGSDANVNVNVDMRKQGLTLLASLTIDELRALANVTDNRELPALPVTIDAETSEVPDALASPTKTV